MGVSEIRGYLVGVLVISESYYWGGGLFVGSLNPKP